MTGKEWKGKETDVESSSQFLFIIELTSGLLITCCAVLCCAVEQK